MTHAQAKKILNFGSLNVDHVYSVDHFVEPGETLTSTGYSRHAGGKGANQSIAMVRAGASVCHAGKLGADGLWLKKYLDEAGVDTARVKVGEAPSGHAIIQVNKHGENAIILNGGANLQTTRSEARDALEGFGPGDILVLQNEVSSVGEVIDLGAAQGMNVVFNPAPMTEAVFGYPLDKVNLFIVNEIEGRQLSGRDSPDEIISAMVRKFRGASTIVTLGGSGVLYGDSDKKIGVPAEKVEAVDTTAAGDTFVGYFIAELVLGSDTEAALKTACRAAALCVSRHGAQDSIPFKKELS